MKPIQWLGVGIIALAVGGPSVLKYLPAAAGISAPAVGGIPQLTQYFQDWASIIEAGGCKTTGDFRAAAIRASQLLQAAGKYPPNPQHQPYVAAQLEAAIGLEDRELTPELRAKLAAALRQLAVYFQTAPPTGG